MPDYAAMYHILFAAQADVIEDLKQITDKLVRAQQQAEELYLSAPRPEISLLKDRDPGKKM